MNDTQLHCHTHGSNLRMRDCIIKTKDLIDRAIELGMKAVAITDHASISEHIQAMKYSQEVNKDSEKIKVLLGSEIYLVNNVEDVKDNYRPGETKFYHFILIAKDAQGHAQLRAINADGWKSSFMTGKLRRVPNDKAQIERIIGDNKGHLIAQTACIGGELANRFFNNEIDKAKEFIEWCVEWFTKDCFAIEIQPSNNPKQISFNKWAKEIAKEYDIKCVVTCDVHYLKKEHHDIHKAFLHSSEADRGETEDFYETTWMMDTNQKKEYFDYLSEDEYANIINNGWNLVKDCEAFSLEHSTIIPERDLSKLCFKVKHIFKKWYNKYEYINKFAHSEYDQDLYYLYMIEEGFLSKKQEFNEENLSRIDWELEQLWLISEALHDRMSAYYNLVDYIVDICWEIGFVGISRGSVTGWYTAWLIDLQQINPIQWNLPAYRHLNAQRVSFPDCDLDTSARNRPRIIQKLKEVFGEDNILNICTFKTETSKAALRTVCRGIGATLEDGAYLASLVPTERGKQWSLTECYKGNPKEDKKAIAELVKESDRLSREFGINFEEYALMIEGLISGLSLHASGIYLFKNGYLKQNSLMKTPRGDNITCWSMEDSDWCGGLKYDSLTTECQDKLEVCMELLLKNKKIEWQGSLRKTYNRYLHPSVLNYDNKQMWEECSKGQISDLFQFITPVGGQCIRKIKPHNITELSNANSLMRITVDGDIQPVDKFLAYKNNPDLWDEELKRYGVTDVIEIEALKSVLDYCYHVPSMQEDVMELLMHKDIANFSLRDSDVARKIIAKKKKDQVQKLHDDFYKAVKNNNHSINLANYVWYECICPQLAYSFSRNHVLPYSAEALQEMNLYHFYPHVYWNCAVLNVNAGLADENSDKNIQYGKVAQAIYRSINFNVAVSPPSINYSFNDFTPQEENNSIFFGINCIAGINSEISKQIISLRPYSSFQDFFIRNSFQGSLVTNSKFIQLIKAGCFDEFEPNRVKLMKQYICMSNPPKDKLTSANLSECVAIGAKPPKQLLSPYNFKSYVCSPRFLIGQHPKFKSKKLYWLDDKALKYFNANCSGLKEGTDWYVDDNGLTIVIDKSLDKLFKPVFDELKAYINTPEFLKEYNKSRWRSIYDKLLPNKNPNHWSLEAVSYYSREHELANVNFKDYSIVPFNSLPEEPVFITQSRGKREWKQYELHRICGTILARNDNNHLLTILTPENDVINVKFYAGLFAKLKAQISEEHDGVKTVLDKPWLARGVCLVITGYRRGESDFVAKKYRNSIFPSTVSKIEEINDDGSIVMRHKRYGQEEAE